MSTQHIAEAYARFYEQLSPKSPFEEYGVFFDKHSKFSDPFQSVQGLEAIHKIFLNMYAKLYEPRFIIDELVCSEEVAYIKWHFTYSLSQNSKLESFSGVSRVTFTTSAKVATHVDFWDAAENVYEKIPLLGTVLRFIKRRVHAE